MLIFISILFMHSGILLHLKMPSDIRQPIKIHTRIQEAKLIVIFSSNNKTPQ